MVIPRPSAAPSDTRLISDEGPVRNKAVIWALGWRVRNEEILELWTDRYSGKLPASYKARQGQGSISIASRQAWYCRTVTG